MTPANTQSDPGSTNSHQLRWDSNLATLVRFIADNGRPPAQGAADDAERKLASWLNHQRGHALPDRVEALDRAIRTWRQTTFDLRWEKHLKATAAFSATYGHHPRPGSSDRDEKMLGSWLVKQRQNTTPERAARLDSMISGWRGSRVQSWSEILDKVVSFVAEHGHVPHQTGAGEHERSLASWLKEQRRYATPERAAALDGAVPNWRGNHPGHRAWEDSFTAVQDFLAETGRLPSRGDKAGRRLAAWLSDQSRRATDEQRAALDAALPGWEPAVVSWAERHAAVVAFLAANGRLPEQTDTGDTRVLGVWLENQRWNATVQSRSILDTSLPGWHVTLEDKWDARLDELVAHIAANGRLPRPGAKNPETSLARWLEKQRRFANAERAVRLDSAAPGWRGKKKLSDRLQPSTASPRSTHGLQ
ncbi:hypothetical protein GCM10023063_17580 [Arthrobacter methylotrophus]|uniref:Helicase associated domain-containing protein n=1 Tax=Arthrobacter methylotrophus TaxID=121291 RepID=A0ABV5UPI8_9MICC